MTAADLVLHGARLLTLEPLKDERPRVGPAAGDVRAVMNGFVAVRDGAIVATGHGTAHEMVERRCRTERGTPAVYTTAELQTLLQASRRAPLERSVARLEAVGLLTWTPEAVRFLPHPERLQARVRASGGALGFAFDGDGDRLIAVDEDGEVRDGDYLLAICAKALKARGALRGEVVVSTVMANLGLERALLDAGVGMVRVQVGDRYVLEEMHRIGANLGGEQSGHAIFLDHATTGDGLVSALQLLRVLRETGQPLRVLASSVTKCPQVLVNVRVRAKPVLTDLPTVGEVVQRWERKLDGRARILVRYSGTEPLARVMVEGDDHMTIEGVAEEIAAVIRAEIGRPV